jgi:hypothetical protein
MNILFYKKNIVEIDPNISDLLLYKHMNIELESFYEKNISRKLKFSWFINSKSKLINNFCRIYGNPDEAIIGFWRTPIIVNSKNQWKERDLELCLEKQYIKCILRMNLERDVVIVRAMIENPKIFEKQSYFESRTCSG